jgi:hypothetical protein
VTSTIQQFHVGQTYDTDVVYGPRGNWCSDQRAGYICTLPTGHEGQHVGAISTGEAVHVWPGPTTDLDTWKQQVRDLAHTIVTSRGYGNFAVWNDTMVRLGLEPFTQKRVRVVAPISRVTVDLPSGYDEDRARGWVEARRDRLADYLRPQDDDLGEPTVEVSEDTPRNDDSVEKDDRADTDDLDEYKAFVREVAIDMGTAQGWCDDGVNGVLEELGLDRKTRKYRVRVRVEAYQYVDVDVEAENSDEAESMVDSERVNDEVDAYAWNTNDWNVSRTESA